MEQDKKPDPKKWYAENGETVFQSLDAGEEGLTAEEAARRLAAHGPNALPEGMKQPAWKRFLLQFHNILIYILLAAAVATALMQHWIDTVVILGVVVVNAIVGFAQEGKAERALEGIRRMLSLEATVKRSGKRLNVAADELVPGDLVYLESGDKVPADLRLISVRNLKVEESPLTGESLPVTKSVAKLPEGTSLGDRVNMAFSGTMVTSGRGVGVVVETGASTEIGLINTMISEVETLKTPLLRQIDHFGKVLSVVILVLALVFWAIGFFLRGFEFTEILLAVIGLAVAAIPEGLPAIMTITLALGVQRMAHRQAIIRRLPSVETLGSVTVICSDKTGTLTRNEMTVQSVVVAGARYRVSGEGYAPEGEFFDGDDQPVVASGTPALSMLIRCLGQCNDADLVEVEGQWTVRGDPTEGGLRALEKKAKIPAANEERLDTLPFESEHKYMATLHEAEGGGQRIIYVKGAPERVLERCTRVYAGEGKTEDYDAESWREKIEEIASRGERVLAAAYREVDAEHKSVQHEDVAGGLVLLGLVGMIDPPRAEAIEAVKACRAAGIRVKMITGDHAKTASAIARQLGLEAWEQPLSGMELDAMDPDALRDAAQRCDVFARTSPENKLRLVEALQQAGEIVAMTGDGVNDAPALKRSDVGIAMGIKGTEVTKDAAEMVLADDNFATIARAVREGRTIYDNLKKAILFILPTNGAQSLVVMLAIAAGWTMPITPVQILWINMVTAVTLAFAFTFEPPEPSVMKRRPRDAKASILDLHFLWRIGFVSVILAGFTVLFFRDALSNFENEAIANAVAVNTLAFGQLFYMMNCRSLHGSLLAQGLFTNKIAWLTAGLLVVLQLLFTYAPPMQQLFGTAAIPLEVWWRILAVGVLVLVVVELEKWILHRWKARCTGTGH